ncbi:MAG: hypothetical protein ACJA2S_003865 [Cyclobacteriaceae bacterium]|jgi:hypothetical protein
MSQVSPSKFMKKFLRWFCKEPMQESIIGDLEEQFEEDIEKHGKVKAKWKFTWNVIPFCCSGIISSSLSNRIINTSMLFHHIPFLKALEKASLHNTTHIISLTGQKG